MLEFCGKNTYSKVQKAYTKLWTTIHKNRAQLSGEVWSWQYDNGYQPVPLSTFSTTESNIVQLWSLTFLAVHEEDVAPSSKQPASKNPRLGRSCKA